MRATAAQLTSSDSKLRGVPCTDDGLLTSVPVDSVVAQGAGPDRLLGRDSPFTLLPPMPGPIMLAVADPPPLVLLLVRSTAVFTRRSSTRHHRNLTISPNSQASSSRSSGSSACKPAGQAAR